MVRGGELSGEKGWLEEAEAAYRRRFGELEGSPRGLFDQMEQASFAAGVTYARRHLEAQLGKLSQGDCEGPQACPWCKRVCEARSEETEEREILTRLGPVRLQRRGYYCPSCRKVFFPSGPGAEAGR
jgi:CRISPR/Cas system-associated protein Cas10 (large subunit of type III CRISPR-Cas system)